MNEEMNKLVVLDLNETLISESTWFELNMAMGVTLEEDGQFMKWYEEGVITYEEGQRLLERIYLSRGKATRDNILNAMKYTYNEGTKELVSYLKEKRYHLALVSGSVDVLVSKVANELGIEDFAAHNKIEFDESGMFKRIVCRGDDADFKEEMLVKYANKLGISVKQAVCVGDGYNDLKAFAACGHGITFKGSKIENSAWKVVKSLEEVKEIL